MAIVQAVCDSFKTQLLSGVHCFANISLTVTSVAAGTGVYTMSSSAAGASNGYAGLVFVMAGFGTAANNGTFLCTASTTTTITTTNTNSANSGAMGTTPVTGDISSSSLSTRLRRRSTRRPRRTARQTKWVTRVRIRPAVERLSPRPRFSRPTPRAAYSTRCRSHPPRSLARGAVIYNSSKQNFACLVLNFTTDQTSTAGTFSVSFPSQVAGSAILGLA